MNPENINQKVTSWSDVGKHLLKEFVYWSAVLYAIASLGKVAWQNLIK